MRRVLTAAAAVLALGCLLPTRGSAAVVQLPYDPGPTVTMTATVSEHANVTLPTAITWAVNNVSAATNSAAATVSIQKIKLSHGKGLKVSLQADAADFTPPTAATATWAAADVSWGAGSWGTGWTQTAGTLSSAGSTVVAQSTANPGDASTTTLVFVLAAKDTVAEAGAHTLSATWKVESFTP